jgi:predicted Rossmann fold nucleotide-binding protein DprA/Smf involved in DNA uptake
MDIRDYLSDGGQAILALCSPFGTRPTSDTGPAPFTLSEWNELEGRLNKSPLKHPAELRNRSAESLVQDLSITLSEAERIAQLFERSSRLALELESLFSKGMWALTRVDENYPAKLRETLKHQAPTVLFGAGNLELFKRPGVAVVGSRNIDEAGARFAKAVGARAVAAGMAVVSGGARGTDRIAMDGALEADGVSLGVLADSLEATIRKADVRELLLDGRLLLTTPYAPTAGFSVGGAMGRNKLIYGLVDYAVVVSSDFQTGGTWAGAMETLKAGWCPVFVRDGDDVPKGNKQLLKKGAAALETARLEEIENLAEWMSEHGKRVPSATELDLFNLD